MNLPSVSSLTHMEATARIKRHAEDTCTYNCLYDLPFGAILDLTHKVPPGVHDEPAAGIRWTNRSHWLGGYDDWGVPEERKPDDADDPLSGIGDMMKRLSSQHLYLPGLGAADLDKPEVQTKKMFAAPVVRQLARFSETARFRELATKVYVLKIELHPMCTSPKPGFYEKMDDPVKVWRLVATFGDTNLDSLHDQIIAPAMGWRRHYLAYTFHVPTSGANFGPRKSDAIDMMHAHHSRPTYFLEAEDYDLRHVLREKGQRLGYVYDLGDQ